MRKLIVVTGGTKGIGRAIIEEFAHHGFDVATCARKKDELDQMSAALKKSFPDCWVLTSVADMSKKNEVLRFTQEVLASGRKVDALVNNAGYFVPGEIATEPEGTLESMMNANLFSAYYATRGLVQSMKEHKTGHIINICSIASIKAYANGGSYAITKFAMLGMTKCLREELKPFGIRVTAVMPGATKTASWAGVDLPDERFMTAEDVATLVYTTHSISSSSVVEEIIIRPQLGDI
jgi:short-subunit dehydrogenase